MDDLTQDFIDEATENLQQAEDALLQLEETPDAPDAINDAFRMMHSIKGAAGFLDLNRIQSVAHRAENLLDKFRNGEATPAGENMRVALLAKDHLREIVNGLAANEGQEPEGDDTEIIQRLDTVLEAPDAASASNSEPARSETQDTGAQAPAASDDPEPTPSGEAAGYEDEASAKPAPDPQHKGAEASGSANEEPASTSSQTPSQSSQSSASGNSNGNETSQKSGNKTQEGQQAGENSGQKEAGASSIRVSTELLDRLQNIVSELVLTRNQMLQIDREQTESPHTSALGRLNQIVTEAQEEVMKTRMQEIGAVLKEVRRIVRDLNQELGKSIKLTTEGEDAELDRQILESLRKPLQHITRNAADHGIETPEERRKAGKPETGRIHMRAHQEAGHVVIDITDDGQGLNATKIAEKAVANGLATEDDIKRMDEEAIRHFLFKPGFSTASEVTNVSGRGVGMDVVRADLERIGGTIELTSTPGKGTTFTLKIPLTLAIISALIVQAGTERFAIPQSGVNEIVRVAQNEDDQSGANIEYVQGAKLLRLRERLLPLVSLRNTLGIDATEESGDRYVVVAQVGSQKFGLIVDRVYDTEEIVVKPTSQILSEIPYYSGCTILGDGHIVMILDPNGVSPPADEADKAAKAETREREEQEEAAEEGDLQSLLVFRTHAPTPKACPLNVVERIEEIKASDIEHADGQAVVQYRGNLMPIVPFDETIDLRTPDADTLSVLVFAEQERRIGFAVGTVEDIAEERLTLNWSSETHGLMGTMVIKGQTTEIVDMGDYMTDFIEWFQQTSDLVADNQSSRDEPRHALFVDDSSLVRSMVMPVPTNEIGLKVTYVQDGEAALQKLQEAEKNPFDVIISDIEMPKKDGLELARDLRHRNQVPNHASTPLIALTARKSEKQAQECLTAGYDAHVPKFHNDELTRVVRESIENMETAA